MCQHGKPRAQQFGMPSFPMSPYLWRLKIFTLTYYRARRGQLSSAISNPPHYNLLPQAHRNQVLNPLSVAINGLRFAMEAICDHVPRTVLDDLTMVSESLQHVEGRIADVFTLHKCIAGEMGEPSSHLPNLLLDTVDLSITVRETVN